MGHRSIERSEWQRFVDSFSRQHDGWLISVSVDEGAVQRRTLVRDAPLRGVVAEWSRGGSLMVFTGDAEPHDTHFIAHPVALSVEETDDAAEAELTITDDAGVSTHIELRSPIRPELVDGIAP